MKLATLEKETTFLKIKGEKFALIPEKTFTRFKRDYSNMYPKLYTHEDNEGVWDTIDFGPEGIDSKELINHLRK